MLMPLLVLLAATAPSSPSYECPFTPTPPAIDGKLDDAAWAKAQWTADFSDLRGPGHPAPSQQTRAKMLWDDQFLYIAAELSDPDVRAELRDHDSPLFRENAFEVFIDPDDHGHDYVELQFNALNATLDLLMSKPYRQGGKSRLAWTLEGLQSAVHIDGTLNDASDRDRGWTIEVAIPWSGLKQATPKQGSRWRVQLARVADPPNERGQYSAWSPTGAIDLHLPDRWGWVQFRR